MDRRKRRRLLSALQSGILEEIRSISNTAIASFTGDGRDLVRLVVGIEPVQDLNGYENPWPGGGGKNLYAGVASAITMNGVTVEQTADGEIWVHGQPDISSGYIAFPIGYPVSDRALNQTVTVSINEKTVGVGFTFGGAGSLNFTLSDTATSRTTNFGSSLGSCNVNVRYDVGTINKKYKVQLEIGSTATAWTPYSNICPISGWTGANIHVSPTTDEADGNTHSITFPSEAGTVYGGTLDVTTGKLTVTHGYAELTKNSNWSWNANNALAICAVSGGVITNVVSQNDVLVQNNMFTSASWADRDRYEYSCGMFYGVSYVFVRSSQHISSVDDLKAILGDNTLQVVYELATPIEVDLTPTQITTLSGVTNNIWADTGDIILLEYMA